MYPCGKWASGMGWCRWSLGGLARGIWRRAETERRRIGAAARRALGRKERMVRDIPRVFFQRQEMRAFSARGVKR